MKFRDAFRGGKTVTGRDAILAALTEHLGAKGAPKDVTQDIVARIAEKLEGAKGLTATFDEDGITIEGHKIEVGVMDGNDDDLQDSLQHLRRSRDGGDDGLSGLFERLKSRREQPKQDDSPIEAFRKAAKAQAAGNAPEPKKKTSSFAGSLMAASTITAMEIMRFMADPEHEAGDIAFAMGKFIDESARAEPAKYANVEAYLSRYSLDLTVLSARLKNFRDEQRSDEAEWLTDQLGRLVPAVLNVMQDAAEKAEREQAAATNI